MVTALATHNTLGRRDRPAGLAHALIFFGFGALLFGTATITPDDDILQPLFGVAFWNGGFYPAFSLVPDLAGVGLIPGLLHMMARRGWIRPPKPDYRRPDRAADAPDADRSFCRIEDWAFLWPLVIIGLTGFLPEAVRLLWLSGAPQVADCRWRSPVGALAASGLQLSGLAPEGAGTLRVGLWWFHAALSLGFVALLPFTKAKHIFTATTSLALRDPTAAQTLGGAQIAGPDCFVAQGDGLNQVTTGTLRACRTCMACPAGRRKAALGGPSAVMRRRLAATPQIGAEALIALLHDPAAPVRAEAARHAPLAALPVSPVTRIPGCAQASASAPTSARTSSRCSPANRTSTC